jgi:ATP-dependent exoDNAse (exonuclease V) beta subunit
LKNPDELQEKLSTNHITDKPNTPVFSETRDKITSETRDIEFAPVCPYCQSKDTVKRGLRKKKYETAQLFLCNSCKKVFTGQLVKGKQFPLRLILEGLCLYNMGHTLEKTCQLLKEQFGLDVKPQTLAEWVKEFAGLCTYERMRPYGLKMYSPHQVIQKVNLYHRQVYDFSYHRAKTALILQDFKHAKFENVREFLEAVQTECPHQFFQEGERVSEERVKFDLSGVMISEKQNFATRLANLALQAVNDNKLRHKALQRFMLCNDSVTVATEVPVYMDEMDIEHMQEALKFKIPLKLDRILTGHIDFLQIRNGNVHILDYKPAKSAKRDKPVTQLTLYALALSRLTGLRLYDFKCAWFDENVYYEFFPLHVVYKLRDRQKKEDPRQMKWDTLVDPVVENRK